MKSKKQKEREQRRRAESIEKMRRTQQSARRCAPENRQRGEYRGSSPSEEYLYNKYRSSSNVVDFYSHSAQKPREAPAERRKQRPDPPPRTAVARPPQKRRTKTRRVRKKKPISPAALRFRRFILSFFVIALFIGVGAFLSLTVWFKTETVRVEGETRYSSDEIIEICPIKTGENIFLSDKKAAAQAIKDALPYVAEAEVKFSIPDTIIIKITEAEPAYQLGTDDGCYIISAEGRILEKMAEPLADVPTLECSGIKNTEIGAYAEFEDEKASAVLSDVIAEINNLEISSITVIDITSTAKVKLLYDDRILIVLGVPEDINYKLRTALTIIDEKLDPNESGIITGRLDVSVCNETKKSYFNENEIYIPPSQLQATGGADPGSTDGSNTSENTDGTSISAQDDVSEETDDGEIEITDPAE